jgi:MerR family mercuric resistance operon transcriptional regulator
VTIGQLSRATGCNIETIRYYERIGILPDPPRSLGGHRLYGEDHKKRLHFVCRSRELGFMLKQVRDLLALVDETGHSCEEVRALTLDHLGSVKRKLADLQRMEVVLADMAASCDGGDVPDCPIVEALYG